MVYPRAPALLGFLFWIPLLGACALPDKPGQEWVFEACIEHHVGEAIAASANAQTLLPPVTAEDMAVARKTGQMAHDICRCGSEKLHGDANLRAALNELDQPKANQLALLAFRDCSARITRPNLQVLCQSASAGLGLVDNQVRPSEKASVDACACVAKQLGQLQDEALGAAMWDLLLMNTQDSAFSSAWQQAARTCTLPIRPTPPAPSHNPT